MTLKRQQKTRGKQIIAAVKANCHPGQQQRHWKHSPQWSFATDHDNLLSFLQDWLPQEADNMICFLHHAAPEFVVVTVIVVQLSGHSQYDPWWCQFGPNIALARFSLCGHAREREPSFGCHKKLPPKPKK